MRPHRGGNLGRTTSDNMALPEAHGPRLHSPRPCPRWKPTTRGALPVTTEKTPTFDELMALLGRKRDQPELLRTSIDKLTEEERWFITDILRRTAKAKREKGRLVRVVQEAIRRATL